MADSKAKRSSVLEALKTELDKGFITKEVEVFGHKFILGTLNMDMEAWSDTFLSTVSPMSMLSTRRVAKTAAAIKSVDGVEKEKLFSYGDDMSKEEKEALDSNPISKRYWVATEMLYFLSEGANRPFIDKLYNELESLEALRDEATKAIPKA